MAKAGVEVGGRGRRGGEATHMAVGRQVLPAQPGLSCECQGAAAAGRAGLLEIAEVLGRGSMVPPLWEQAGLWVLGSTGSAQAWVAEGWS